MKPSLTCVSETSKLPMGERPKSRPASVAGSTALIA
jgi:hypothetical protein